MPETATATESSPDDRTPCTGDDKVLTLSSMNPHMKGSTNTFAWMNARASEIDRQLVQVIALCTFEALFNNPLIPADAKQRAGRILASCPGRSIGSYTDAVGLQVIREDVASYIAKRDNQDCDVDDVFLYDGATTAIQDILKLFVTGKDDILAGVMIPIPEYPLYGVTLQEFNSYAIPYFLDEERQWSLDTNELHRALDAAREHCVPRAIVVINPGNPTGQVLSRQNIENVIKFAHKEKLFILADEVYQLNIYGGPDVEFHSFKKVMKEMGGEYANMQLASFMTASKGYTGECGYRGGYCELINIDPDVRRQLIKLISSNRCPTVTGQVAMGVVASPPVKDEPSYKLFEQEKGQILGTFAQKASMVTTMLNDIDGVQCNEISGSMFAYPRLTIPEKAIHEALTKGQKPDTMYCCQLLEEAGIYVVPGEVFGQKKGTYHFRMTILSSIDELKQLLNRLKVFHEKFTARYS